MLGDRAVLNRLEKYYIEHFGESVFDEWHGGPINVWKFDRGEKTYTLTCDRETGIVIQKTEEKRSGGFHE